MDEIVHICFTFKATAFKSGYKHVFVFKYEKLVSIFIYCLYDIF